MLTYSFENIGSDKLYGYLYKCIKTDIIKGVLRPNDKLPSKRGFAKHLGISVITVETAYAQLIAEGYLYSYPKRGFFVAKLPAFTFSSIPSSEEDSKIKPSPTIDKEYFMDFSNNQTDSSNFPFSIWAKLMREVLLDYQNELMISSPCSGIFYLREVIAKHLYDFRNMHVLPEQIIIGAGTEYLYGLLIQLLGFDLTYGVEDPGYDKISKIYKSNQVKCEHIFMDSQGISINDMDNKKVDVMHLSPSHHFPTGMIVPIARRYELLAWACKDTSHYIIEDEYDSEFRFVGRQIPSLQSIDISQKVIYMNTFSKSLASTIRISYMILPKNLVKKFYEKMGFYSCTVSTFEQFTLAKFIDNGSFEKHINRTRNQYHLKRDTIIASIRKSSLGRIATILEADSGLHFLLKLQTDLCDSEICENCKKNGIKLRSLSHYYQETTIPNSLDHTFVINYSSLNLADLEEALELIYNSLNIFPTQ